MTQKDYKFWVKFASRAALVIVTVIVLSKTWAWLFSGSAAMLGSLTDSLLDLTATSINFFVLRYALLPADDDHRFGHGKAESLAGLAQAAFISGSALLLAFHGVERLVRPVELSVSGNNLTIYVSVLAIALTFVLLYIQRLVISKTGSVAIKADSLHYQGDLLLNASVIIAMVLAGMGWQSADASFSILIALFLLFNAWQIAVESSEHLMDKELAETERQEITTLIESHQAVHAVMAMRTRKSGQTKFIQFNLALDDSLSLVDAHQVADEIEALLKQRIEGQLDVVIHQEPRSLC
ncbi:cation diffusion facilitator family transporter [Psychrobium sp. 1_MG-2023]|uniref:cation diffusion facilitator family transporter n=1 Tax=Psychrobium sp. 1_MG-2023 TaxID=3062624 RepID=UPI000C33D1D4|nr:cation diffusion facilitator family transporter [Psychrobium sp. 1_MG-2023]MDP2561888.1 cation diffusion facilitator family transporter [Psychrobium sp. 1_MG-2023]PKF59696.1 divalent metal cation transporter FieF [Alteromonadales bacterium alter-6D02]